MSNRSILDRQALRQIYETLPKEKNMRVMVLVKATESSEKGTLPSEAMMIEMGNFNEKLVKAGVMQAGEGLKPSSHGVRIRFSGASRTKLDGPFPETKELVAGFWIWEVESMDQAIEWVRQCPNPMPEDSDIEIRPLYEMSDFAEQDPSQIVEEQEEELRHAVAMQQSSSIQPYLFFSGRCEEALEFYRTKLHAKIGPIRRFNESPDPVPAGMLQDGFESKIMHVDFQVGTTTILASDGCDDKTPFSGFRLTLTVPNESDVDRIFHALAEEGSVEMPPTKTFWSPRFAMVTDKFRVGWMVMVQNTYA